MGGNPTAAMRSVRMDLSVEPRKESGMDRAEARGSSSDPFAIAGANRTHCGFIPIGNQLTSPLAAAAASEEGFEGSAGAGSGTQY